MRHLILVKHSLPEIIPDVPAAQWQLSTEGRRRCDALAARLATYRPTGIVASTEPKVSETGALVAKRLGLPLTTSPDLHEHDRTNVGYLGTNAWEQAVRTFFEQPSRLILGRETARQAGNRFVAAVDRVMDASPNGDIVIVSHGTVISLYVAACTGKSPYPLWQRLDLPSFVVLSLPAGELLDVVASVEDGA